MQSNSQSPEISYWQSDFDRAIDSLVADNPSETNSPDARNSGVFAHSGTLAQLDRRTVRNGHTGASVMVRSGLFFTSPVLDALDIASHISGQTFPATCVVSGPEQLSWYACNCSLALTPQADMLYTPGYPDDLRAVLNALRGYTANTRIIDTDPYPRTEAEIHRDNAIADFFKSTVRDVLQHTGPRENTMIRDPACPDPAACQSPILGKSAMRTLLDEHGLPITICESWPYTGTGIRRTGDWSVLRAGWHRSDNEYVELTLTANTVQLNDPFNRLVRKFVARHVPGDNRNRDSRIIETQTDSVASAQRTLPGSLARQRVVCSPEDVFGLYEHIRHARDIHR